MRSNYEELLEEMPRIAEAVNDFESIEVQQQAFDALVVAYWGGAQTAPDVEDGDPGGASDTRKETPKENGQTKPAARKKRSSPKEATPKILSELDLHPEGRASLREFAEEKMPSSYFEKILVAVHYMQHQLDLTGLGVDHVWTCFKHLQWKTPTMPRDYLRQTANKKGWLDATNGYNDLRVSVAGENYVAHDLPPSNKAEDA